jgi:hypothetical protein
MNSFKPLSRPVVLASCVLALAACGDREPLTPPAPLPTGPSLPVLAGSLQCTASIRAKTVECGAGTLPSDARGYIIVGGQGSYVQLTSSNVAYDGGTHVFSFDVTVQNLIPQPMGTTNGTTPDGSGVRVIFASGPTVNSGTGSASVASPDGTGSFTGAGQPYYTYAGTQLLGADAILTQNETSSARTWTLNVDPTVGTFSFTLYVVAEVPHPNGYVDVTPGAPNVLAGSTTGLAATVRSAVGNPVAGSVTWGTSDNAVATVDGSGTVTGVAPGTVTITATSGARSGTATVAVCPNLAVGGVYVAAAGSFCIGTGSSAAEYTLSPVNLGITDVSYSMTGSGIVAVSGPPSPDRLAPARPAMQMRPAPVSDDAFHLGLMRRGIAEAPRLSGGVARERSGRLRANIVPGVPAVGLVMNLNVSTDYCSTLDLRASTVKAVGTHIILMEDNSNPSGGFTTAQYDSIAATFDTLVYPAVAGTFGSPHDIDSNNRVIALYTSAVNDLTPAGSGSYIGGFFYSRDLYQTTACPGSNQGEMFYMLAPDPTGAHGNVRSTAFVEGVTIGTLGHEFQHLINASLRLGNTPSYEFEQVWLNEGLSHIAEEEVYYASSLHGPGENIGVAQLTANQTQQDRFFQFAEPNFGRLRQWLLSPSAAGAFRDEDNLAIRGAAWAFLRYAADRKGGVESTFFSGLAFSPDTGMTNLQNRLGTDPKPWFRDFVTAMYLDDSGTGAAATYTQPSWNFRGIFTALDYDPGPGCTCSYPLATRNPSNGVAQNFTVSQGAGTAYVRMGVPASSFAGVTTNTAPSSSFALVVMRTK